MKGINVSNTVHFVARRHLNSFDHYCQFSVFCQIWIFSDYVFSILHVVLAGNSGHRWKILARGERPMCSRSFSCSMSRVIMNNWASNSVFASSYTRMMVSRMIKQCSVVITQEYYALLDDKTVFCCYNTRISCSVGW